MLYPTLDSLTKKVGNRYLLVNIVARRAREIAKQATDEGVKLPDKPVKLAVMEINKGGYPHNTERKANAEKSRESEAR